jgi:inner membrane protein
MYSPPVASIGHVAVGIAAARATRPVGSILVRAVALSAFSLLPDVDVVGFAAGVPYGAPWGHRGATHSLAMAVFVGMLCGVAVRVGARGPDVSRCAWSAAAVVALVVASHGLLDAMTDGGRGVALLWPFTAHRYFLPWRPIPVAPIGIAFFSVQGMRVAAVELLEFAPFLLYGLWPRRPAPRRST